MYSQKKEDNVIWEYFKNSSPSNFLDIGANDGRLFSNSLWLIEHGWGGVMVEPSPKAFAELLKNHGQNPKLYLINQAITNYDGVVDFYESGQVKVIGRVKNVSLVSSIHKEYLPHWKMRQVPFEKLSVPCKSFASFLNDSPIKKFKFITIDTEGEDWNILKQIDLGMLKCEFLCIEHDKNILSQTFIDYCSKWDFKEVARTQVNLLLAK